MKYSADDLAVMARMVEHARWAEPSRYRALVEAVHRRSGVRRDQVRELIRQFSLL